MTKREVEKLPPKAGIKRHSGRRYDIWTKEGFPPIPVHRHKGDIPIGSLKNILKTVGLEKEE